MDLEGIILSKSCALNNTLSVSKYNGDMQNYILKESVIRVDPRKQTQD